jgi:hypothetical protein
MRTESERTFEHGFLIDEQNVRRVFELCRKRMELRVPAVQVKTKLSIKFRNDAIASPTTIDEILTLENVGSKGIVKLRIEFDDGKQKPDEAIVIEFQDTSGASTKNKPVSYSIVGGDRDWVFVTKSELDERISQLKTLSLEGFADWVRPAFTVIMVGSVIVGMSYAAKATEAETDHARRDLRSTRDRLKAEGANPFDAVFAVSEVALERKPNTGMSYVMVPLILITIFSVFISAVRPSRILAALFPSYHFYWGGYIQPYEKRKTRANFVIVVIVVGLIISVLGNYLTGCVSRLVGITP